MFVRVKRGSVLHKLHKDRSVVERVIGRFHVNDEKYQKFREEADAVCPHLTDEEKHAWAAYNAHQHRGHRGERRRSFKKIRRVAVLTIILMLLLAWVLKAEPHPINLVITKTTDSGIFHLVVPSNLLTQGVTSMGSVNILKMGGVTPTFTGSSLNVNCTAGCTPGGSFADNAAFTAGATAIGVIGGWFSSAPSNCTDGSACAPLITNTRHLFVTCDNCGGSTFTDNSAFTAGTSTILNVGAVFNDGLAAVTSGNAANPRITTQRGLHVNLRNNAGTEIGTASTPVRTDPTGTTTQPVSGTVTTTPPANASTNVAQWNAVALGSPSAYGTSPGAVNVPGVNAFITNTPAVTLTSTTITGTVAVTESGTWTNRIVGNAGGILDTTQNAAVAANSLLQGCNFTTAPATLTTGNQGAVQCNNKGELLTQLTDGTTNVAVIAATTALKTDLSSVAGTATVTGTGAGGAGIQRVTVSNDSSLAANQSVNLAQVAATNTVTDGTAGVQAVGGHFANNATAAGTNKVPVMLGIAQTSYAAGTAYTVGRDVVPDVFTDGALHVSALPAMRPASYHASASFAGSSTTFAAHLAGNATNTVLVTKVMFSCTQTTAGTVTVTVNKTSAASSGGTAATMTAVPDDSNYAAASSVAQSFTGTGPTVGTLVGQIDADKMGCIATATASPNDIYILNLRMKPIVLRGTAQTLEIGVGAAVTGGNFTATWEWMETATITP